jgi:hypothetical protein
VQVQLNTPAGKESGSSAPSRGRKPRKGESSGTREEEQEQEGYTHKTSGFKTSGLKTSGSKTSETSGLQNVRFQNVRSSKRPVAKKHPYILYFGWWKTAGSVAAMFAGKVMAMFYSLF